MKKAIQFTLLYVLSNFCISFHQAQADPIPLEVASLLDSECLHCHDSQTQTRLDLTSLDFALSDEDSFRQWESIYDRIDQGEMPPTGELRPEPIALQEGLKALKSSLHAFNAKLQQTQGRVPSRRLTRLEYEYTLQDIFKIQDKLGKILPEEEDAAGFDTLGKSQRLSSIHIRSYLEAADQALESAIKLGKPPETGPRDVDYFNAPYVNRWYDIPLNQGGSIIKKLDDAVAFFVDTDYIARSDACGLVIKSPGVYQITVEAYPYQATTPVTLKIVHSSEKQGGASMLGAFDLLPGQARTVQVSAYLRPGDFLYPSVADLDGGSIYSAGGAKNFKGEGVAVKSMRVEGPLMQSWPPASTQNLFAGMTFTEKEGKPVDFWGKVAAAILPSASGSTSRTTYQLEMTQTSEEHLVEIFERLAPQLFRRPGRAGEIESFMKLAEPALQKGVDLPLAIKAPLRSMLCSPQFLFFDEQPGELDNYALASRLSYFLWRSLPDQELFALAEYGQLKDPKILSHQIDRMLEDERSKRFVKDFLGQWLGLDDLNATTPDKHLYPEFDDVLSHAIKEETELFFGEMIQNNLTVGNLIDSKFTFLNRRLAEHYGLNDQLDRPVKGQQMRRVALPPSSLRGGILTQASILKLTANGTVTSPVIRGNFVLTNLLGTPPGSPPPTAGSIEPDTRGTTTVRQTLDAHRNIESCATCHRLIDPPGFALESFDPIGGLRERYRSTVNSDPAAAAFTPYGLGQPVDASGTTAEGESFRDISEYKKLLMQEKTQVAKNLFSQLTSFSTGSEIQFSDRAEVAQILDRLSQQDYPLRSMIHELVRSNIFQHK